MLFRSKNLPANPYPTFSSGTAETCGSSGLGCFRFLDPGNSTDNTTINGIISTLNSIAGCNVFLPVPSSGDIPPNSNVIFLLGAAGCGLDNPSLNMNFSNHCSGSTPLTQYFVVVGNRLVKKMCMIRRRNAESCVSMGMMDSYLMNNICCRSSFLCLYFCDWCLHRVVT